MEASDVWGSIADDQVGLLALKDTIDGPHGLFCCDVSLKDCNAVYRSHFLQVNRDDFDLT